MTKGIKGFRKGHAHSDETKRKISEALSRKIAFNCDNCNEESHNKPSEYKKKKRHFCSRECYSEFRKTKLPMTEQHAYKGIRKEGESRQIYHSRYCKNNPKLISHLKARRYATERGAEGNHSLKEWEDLKAKHKHKCLYCKEGKPLTKDHIKPLSEGGTDYIENIQPLCRNCNSKKWKHIYENPELLDMP